MSLASRKTKPTQMAEAPIKGDKYLSSPWTEKDVVLLLAVILVNVMIGLCLAVEYVKSTRLQNIAEQAIAVSEYLHLLHQQELDLRVKLDKAAATFAHLQLNGIHYTFNNLTKQQ